MTTRLSNSTDLFYQPLIRFYVEKPNFVERPWLTKRIETAFSDPDWRFLLLTAEPGAGKTAFVAWLVREHQDWPRYFIRRDSQTPLSSGDARSFLFTIGHQLAASRPVLFRPKNLEIIIKQRIGELQKDGKATGVSIEELYVSPFYKTSILVEQDAKIVLGELEGLSAKKVVSNKRFLEIENLQYLALLDPARVLLSEDPNAKIVIILDALDELRYYLGKESILSWLANCPELPPNIRFIITSRPDEMLDVLKQRQKSWLKSEQIDPKSKQVKADLHRYSNIFVAKDKVEAVMTINGIASDQFVAEAVEKSDGNFQYLASLFGGIEDAIRIGNKEQQNQLLRFEDVPSGLENLYSFFLNWIKHNIPQKQIENLADSPFMMEQVDAWEAIYQPILGILAVSREPLTAEQIMRFSGFEGVQRLFLGALGRLSQFLDYSDDKFRLYHTTFAEFLTSIKTLKEHPFHYLDPVEWHSRIAKFYLKNFADIWSDSDEYGLGFVVYHVIKAQFNPAQLEDALRKIFTLSFMAVRAEHAGWHMPFVRDLKMVGENSPAQVVTPCLKILLGSHRNSLVNQEVLRLLTALYPELQAGKQWSTRAYSTYEVIRSVIAALNRPAYKVIPDLEKLLTRTKNIQVKGVIALALGETNNRDAIPILRQTLIKVKPREDHVSWCAADALIALNTPDIIDPSLITTLKQDFNEPSIKHSIKQRILYILGRMGVQLPFEEARKLTAQGLKLHGNSKVRAIDLIWLLLPKTELDKQKWVEEFEPFLWDKLGFNPKGVEYDKRPTWNDEWVQKRMVTALGRIGSAEAKKHLERFAREIGNRSKPTKKSLERKRVRLEQSIQRAIFDLQSRYF